MEDLLIGNFKASKDDKGLWVYKSIDSKSFKVNGALKKHLRDLPRYKVINEMEDSFKKDSDKFLGNLTIDLVKKIKQLSNEK